ncbi:MAG: DUF5686 family protein [Bacteroidia bacterium]
MKSNKLLTDKFNHCKLKVGLFPMLNRQWPIVRLFLITLIFNAAFLISNAQVTKVTGKVNDVLTNEPIPFVAVVFKGTTDGANTDFDGKYEVSTTKPADSVIFTCVGYKRVAFKLKKGQAQVINVKMKINHNEIGEITVKAGENPADILFRKIIEHKDDNNKRKLESYQYQVYNKVEFDLANISEKFKNGKLIKPFAFIFDKIDSSETNEKPFLPMFITENLSNFYYKTSPKQKKEIIYASKVSGLENASVTQFMGDMYQSINVYDNFIDVFGKSFVSPIAGIGQLYYKYYLSDSLFIDNNWCYKMKFKPRRQGDLTFIGDFWVHDTTFAIKKIQMRLSEKANINFIEDLALVEEFKWVDNKNWMPSKDLLVLEFAPLKNQEGMSMIGRKTTTYKDFVINQPINDSVFKGPDDITVLDNAMDKDISYWNENRHDSLSEREKGIYAMVDTIQTLPAYKTYVDILTLFFTGYKEVGKFDFGPYFTTLSFNAIEGVRFRLGGKTNVNFSDKIQLNGYLAYGTKDGRFKFSAGADYYFSKKPRVLAGFQYIDDIQQLGQSENAFQDDNILSSLFRRSPSNKLTETIGRKIYYEREWFEGLSNRITFTYGNLNPIGTLSYAYYTNPEKTEIHENIIQSQVSLFTRFLLHEKFVVTKHGRTSLGSTKPLIQTNLTQGFKGVLKSDFSYTKIDFKISDNININPIGYGYYNISFGKMWGVVPYPLLFVHPGNETYFYDYAAFNMMNYYEFVSDFYGSIYYAHHFDGFFLNKIPLLRKLKWREVASIKAISGYLSDRNREILVNPNAFSSLTKPYMEAGLGVENILKILRVDFLWRMTYNNEDYFALYKERFPDTKLPPQFGIRASLQLSF